MAHTMRITSNLVAGVDSGYYLDVESDETVGNLRNKISEKRDIPLAQVILLYEGQELVDGQLLSKYGISHNATVQVSDALTITITLQEFGGEQRALMVDVSPQMELGELKYLAGQVVGVHGIGLNCLAFAIGNHRCFDFGEALSATGIVNGDVVTIIEVPGNA